jgi:hypothetical protein
MGKNYAMLTVVDKCLKTLKYLRLMPTRSEGIVCRITQPWRASDRKTPYRSKYSHFSGYV